MKHLNTLLLVLVFLGSTELKGQTISYDQLYLVAREEFDNGKFEQAAAKFGDLMVMDPANEKAGFVNYFYGISKYKLGDLEEAKDIFLSLTRNYREWPQLSEVHLWLCKVFFELENPFQANYYAGLAAKNNSLTTDILRLRNTYYANLDLPALMAIYDENTDDAIAASFIARKLVEIDRDSVKQHLLEELIVAYNIDSTFLGLTAPPDVFKDKYKVAVMLPLFTERLWHSGVYLQKSLAVDLYEGMQMALKEIDTTKIEIEVFDTKRNKAITENIIASGQLNDVDAILGPLYPEPIALVSAYSKENKVNFINPVSTNSEIIENNPYAFLLRSSDVMFGEQVAEYTKTHLDTGAFAVYYGPRKTDSLTAYTYAATIEADSFFLAIRQRTSTTEARQIFDSLTSSVQVIDTAKLYEMYRNGEEVRFMPQRDSLLLPVDSLGHIFVASDNQAIASEVMAALAYRGDTTQLIGIGNWFSVPNAGLDLMEKLNVWLAMQEFENMLLPENLRLGERYREKYAAEPSKYVFYGYYAMKFISDALVNYGVYFQNGYKNIGNIDSLFDYRKTRENKHLVIYRLVNGRPVVVLNNQVK